VLHEPDVQDAHDAPPPLPFDGVPPWAANVENFLWTFRLSQWGHTGRHRPLIPRTSFSNPLPQSSHANS